MRPWSLHSKYLDAHGLVALWRKELLAQAVLRGETKGYRRHPQLLRFRHRIDPALFIMAYLQHAHSESVIRGYRFDDSKIFPDGITAQIDGIIGQLGFEWLHLAEKLRERTPERYAILLATAIPAPHPLFDVVPGDVASWERGARWRGSWPLRAFEDSDAATIVHCRTFASRRSASWFCHQSNLGRCLGKQVSATRNVRPADPTPAQLTETESPYSCDIYNLI